MSSSELNSFLREVASQEREEEVGRVLGKALKLDPFDVLQIPPTASAAEATKAFRRISLLVHPDKVGAELRESARKAQVLLAQAKSDFADEAKRAHVLARYEEAAALVERRRAKQEKAHRKEFRKLQPAGKPPPVVWPLTLEEEVRAAARELLIDEEWRRRQLRKKAQREEQRAHEEKERRQKEADERRKAAEEWEGGREERVSSWRSFGKKRAKKRLADVRTRTLDAEELEAKRRRMEEAKKREELRARAKVE